MSRYYAIATHHNGKGSPLFAEAIKMRRTAAANAVEDAVFDMIAGDGMRDTKAGWAAYSAGQSVAAQLRAGPVTRGEWIVSLRGEAGPCVVISVED